MFKNLLSVIVSASFFLTSLGPLPRAHADILLGLPEPGTMIDLSPAYQPALIKGLTVHKDNPFLFDFIVDTGRSKIKQDALKKEGDRLVKYFFACLTVPEKDLWVNLSPYEKDRMVPQALGRTALGRDLLAQDYILKQITASLIYPERNLGKEFWDRVYSKSGEMYGTTQIPVNTFNKVWILADKATVYENGQTAFVVDGHLKVMLDEDYLALQKHRGQPGDMASAVSTSTLPTFQGLQLKAPQGENRLPSNTLASQIIRQIILPEIEREVNTGENFATLRQIYNSLILATWYKKNLKQALLSQVYADKNTVKGIERQGAQNQGLSPQQIYQQYIKAYKKGVFNYIKEDAQPDGHIIPRKYFSGGFRSEVVITEMNQRSPGSFAMMSKILRAATFICLTVLVACNKENPQPPKIQPAQEVKTTHAQVQPPGPDDITLRSKGLMTNAHYIFDKGKTSLEFQVNEKVLAKTVMDLWPGAGYISREKEGPWETLDPATNPYLEPANTYYVSVPSETIEKAPENSKDSSSYPPEAPKATKAPEAVNKVSANNLGNPRVPAKPAPWQSAGPSGGGRFVNLIPDISITDKFRVGSDVSGLASSIDNGGNWQFSVEGLSATEIVSWIQAPSNPNEIVLISSSGVSLSLNGGATWQTIGTQISTKNKGHNTVVILPSDDKVIYAGGDDGSVKVTLNRGTTWSDLTKMDGPIQNLYITPNSSTLFIGTAKGLRVWDLRQGTSHDVTFSGNSSIHIANANEIRGFTWGSKNYVMVTVGTTLARTTDNGTHWNYTGAITLPDNRYTIYRFDVTMAAGNPVIYALTAEPSNMYHHKGWWVSTDLGATWKGNPEFENRFIYDAKYDSARAWHHDQPSGIGFVTADPHNAQRVFVGDDWGVYRSDNGGQSFTENDKGLQNQVLTDIQVDPMGGIIASGMDHGILRSVDNGVTWTSLVPNGAIGQGYPQFAGHVWKFVLQGTTDDWKAGRGTIIAAASPWKLMERGDGAVNQIFISHKNGEAGSWMIASTPFNVPLTGGMWGNGYARSMGQSSSGRTWVGMDGQGKNGQGGLYYSDDSGASWHPSPVQPPIRKFYNGLAVSPADPTGNTVVIAGFAHNQEGVIYLTVNGGKSWIPFKADRLGPWADELRYTYQIKYGPDGHIYAGTDHGDLWRGSVSPDGNGSFEKVGHFENGDKDPQVDGLTFDKKNPNRMFLSLSYPGDHGRIFMTTNLSAGPEASWTDITGSLPTRQGSGSMTINDGEGKEGSLYIATYGSGIFKVDLSKVDHAAIAGNTFPGGIDLNSANMAMTVTQDATGGVKINLDPATIAHIRQQGVQSVVPVIIDVHREPLGLIWPLLGFNLK